MSENNIPIAEPIGEVIEESIERDKRIRLNSNRKWFYLIKMNMAMS
jgi:hypothetical protein